MAIKMRKAAMQLTFREGKPTVYKLRQLVFPAIKHKNLIKYIANSANLPETTVEAAIAAVCEGILYFSINGHRVTFPNFGGFYVHVKTKTARSLRELKPEDNIVSATLRFAPNNEIREAVADTATEIISTGAYVEQED